MAHNINFEKGVASFASKQQPAWHGLGKVVDAMTEDVEITNHTIIRAGSLLSAGSSLAGKTYDSDTKLSEDVETDTEGLIKVNSKIFINSVINNSTIKPPFVLDIDDASTSSNTISGTAILDKSLWSYDSDNHTITINVASPFKNVGDMCFIRDVDVTLDGATSVNFSDATYSIDGVMMLGTTATLKYYGTSVKIVP